MAGNGEGCGETVPDRAQRDLIVTQLDRNMLVEAAAGTGKTTSMALRMLALLRSGRCAHIRNLAAITFTRKAAGEIRSRFQVELERAAREASGIERERLQAGLDESEQCFIGTIHSFCASLLRERPVEAGVDPSFREADEAEDNGLREEAWGRFAAILAARDEEGLLGELRGLGLRLSDLRASFLDFAAFPDVEEWPLPEAGGLEETCAAARKELEEYLSHVKELQPSLPAAAGNDKLIPLLRTLPRVASHHDLQRADELMTVLEFCDRSLKSSNIVQKVWKECGLTADTAKEERRLWESFRTGTVVPVLSRWREARYGAAMRALAAANELYGRLKEERGLLNFQDLLMRAAALLRDNPGVRKYFQQRFTHLLVDEFQDTDPIQAEVVFLLSSDDVRERDWRRCSPRAGSLFLVGDPKQSIYRFRRADIVTYREAKRLLVDSGGLVVTLSANFRALPSIIDWVNRVFEPVGDGESDDEAVGRFPRDDCELSPAYVALLPERGEEDPGTFRGIYSLNIPRELTNNDSILPYEADLIARFIRHALDEGMTIPRSRRETELGLPPHVLPSDFMILTAMTKNLRRYAEKLQEYGIPHQVSGGGTFKDVEELRLLHLCLRALVRPHDPVALVAVLRSELFGISDAALYSYKKRGGPFYLHATVPQGLPAEDELAFLDAFTRLRRYREWLFRMPPAAACERIADDLGLAALAASRPGGDVRAGTMCKALELLRRAEKEAWSLTKMADFLDTVVAGQLDHEGMSALSAEPHAVRVLNLHKAKGLEAPVVFLADPTGESRHSIERHVDRSGEATRGYLAIYDRREKNVKILAHPADWESLAARESAFLDAESVRLRYVAATRAGVACIVSVRERSAGLNPWNFFERHLGGRPSLPVPEHVKAPAPQGEALDGGEVREAARRTEDRIAGATAATYRVMPAKEYAAKWASENPVRPMVEEAGPAARRKRTPPRGKRAVEEKALAAARDEHEAEWGEVIHLLLQVAMERPQADLLSLARAALQERDVDASLAEEAVLAARDIASSPLWERARRSACRLVETPFHILRDDGSGIPTVIRGVVDLAFRESEGWVLVDYKTGGHGGRKPRGLEPDYAAQILFYAQAWEQCTGQEVKEALVYLVDANLLYRVS